MIAAFEARFNEPGTEAGAAVLNLGVQVQNAQGVATQAVQAKSTPQLRLPKPPKFHGVCEGPRILELCKLL